MREPIRVEIVQTEPPPTGRDKLVAFARGAVSLIKDIGAISALLIAIGSFFPDGRAVLASLLSLNEPETPSVEQTEANAGVQANDTRVTSDLSPLGWSYLGKEDEPSAWYYPSLANLDASEWVGAIIEPRTAIYLRSEPVSAANPDPVALAVIGNSEIESECLRVVDRRISNTGSIWLRGAMVLCAE